MGQASRKRDTLYQGSPAEESSVGLVAFRTGTRAVLEMGEKTPKDGFRFRVLGSEGTIDAALDEVVLTDRNGITTFRDEHCPGVYRTDTGNDRVAGRGTRTPEQWCERPGRNRTPRGHARIRPAHAN